MIAVALRRFSWMCALLFSGLATAGDSIVVVVMDPLSAPLSCDCVRGYAQRKYETLAEHLEVSLNRPIDLHWFESMAEATQEIEGPIDIVIGKDSVIRADLNSLTLAFEPIATLSGKDGSVTQQGFIVVRSDDPAQTVKDLEGYQLLFGTTDAEEKSSAIENYLNKEGVKIDASRERFGACSEAASALVKMPADRKVAAVISSYAEPLLGGCGVVKKGQLRVVAKTHPVPFISLFVRSDLDSPTKLQLQKTLLLAGTNPKVLTDLETLAGFLPYVERDGTNPKSALKKKSLTNPIALEIQ
jgi:ABC-type phosphate/phosphonate transport system substrate-binding protein